MNDKFDELTKGLAQSVTRRGALKKFGVGFAGIALASLGLANSAMASGGRCRGYLEPCIHSRQCCSGLCYFGDNKRGTCSGFCSQPCK